MNECLLAHPAGKSEVATRLLLTYYIKVTHVITKLFQEALRNGFPNALWEMFLVPRKGNKLEQKDT